MRSTPPALRGLLCAVVCGMVWAMASENAAHAASGSAMSSMSGVSMLIPPRMASPVPVGLLKVLQLLTFFGHIVLVNIVLGSVILAVVDRRDAATTARHGVAFLPQMLALAVNFGVAPFLFLQVAYGSFLYPSLVLMAVWWLCIVLAVMLAYYGLYVSDLAVLPPRRVPVLALTAVLLLAAAFVLTNMSTLMISPGNWRQWFNDPHGTILNLGDPTLFPRYAHMVIASLAVGGLVMAWRAWWSGRKPETDAVEAARHFRRGLDWFFYASLAQAASGLLFLFSLPQEVRALFLGESAVHTIALVLVLAGLCIALYLARQGELKRVTVAALGVILLMVCVRDLLRDAMLRSYAPSVSAPPLPLAMPQGQNLAFALFVLSLGVAAVTLLWMGRVVLRCYRSGKPEIGEG